MDDVKTELSRTIVINRNGGQVFADAHQAAIARRGQAERRKLRQEAAEKVAREALARMVDTLSPERVRAYVIRKGGAYLTVWGEIVRAQAELALEGKRGSTQAASFVGRAIGVLGEQKRDEQVTNSSSGLDELSGLLALYRAACVADPTLAARACELLARRETSAEERGF